MSAYHKTPEWAVEWPDFVPPPGDPRWLMMLIFLAVLALFTLVLLTHLLYHV